MSYSKKRLFARSGTGLYMLFEVSIDLRQTEVVHLPPAGPLHRVEFHLGG